jgi:mevalonate kinase
MGDKIYLNPRTKEYFPAKLLLFGEYTVLLGFPALALPLHMYYGCIKKIGNPQPQAIWEDWMAYLQKEVDSEGIYLDLNTMKREYEEGWRFQSQIPIGYGLGSSGVLCAATLERYGTDITIQKWSSLPWVKDILSNMESFFHEKSSGIDPVVSFYDQAFMVESKGKLRPVNQVSPIHLNHFYLVDSQNKRDTSKWVKLFKERCLHSDFMEAMQLVGQAQQKCLEAFLRHSEQEKALQELSELQFLYMKDWIPSSVLSLWEEGLNSGRHLMKLCGAGGGGYFLLYNLDKSKPPSSSLPLISLGKYGIEDEYNH